MGAKKTKLLVAELPLAGAEHDSLEQLRAAGVEFDPEYPPERPDLRRAWERAKLIRKARKTLVSSKKSSSGLATGRKDRCRLCAGRCERRSWKYDILMLNDLFLAKDPSSNLAVRCREIAAALDEVRHVEQDPLTATAVERILTLRRHAKDRDEWRTNRTALMAMSSHLSEDQVLKAIEPARNR